MQVLLDAAAGASRIGQHRGIESVDMEPPDRDGCSSSADLPPDDMWYAGARPFQSEDVNWLCTCHNLALIYLGGYMNFQHASRSHEVKFGVIYFALVLRHHSRLALFWVLLAWLMIDSRCAPDGAVQ